MTDPLLGDLNIRHELNAPLAQHTWYGVGGPARAIAYPSSIQQLSALADRCYQEGVEVYVLGRGANLLVADEGVDGVVVRLEDDCFKQYNAQGTTINVGAGHDLAKLVLTTAKAGLAGCEVLAGIPATVGGGIRMNAGGAFGDIGQSVRRVHVMDASGQVYYRDRDDLVFEYRHTNIMAKFILGAELELQEDDPEELIKRVKEIFLYKKSTQPLGEDSAGCAFRNPSPDQLPVGTPASAGALIDQADLKGYREGGAEISKLHANFVIAHDGATASDIDAVMTKAQEEVFEKFGVKLQREVVRWPLVASPR